MMRKQRAIRFVLLSQLSMWVFLVVCTMLMPRFLFERDEGGVSNYGVHALTVIPYSLGFGLAGVFMLLAALNIPQHLKVPRREIQIVLSTLGCLLLLVLLTTYPYKIDRTYDNLHISAAIVLFAAELFTGIWLVVRIAADRLNIMFLAIQMLGSLLSLLTLAGKLHVLFVCQFIVGLSFSILVVRALSQILDTQEKQ